MQLIPDKQNKFYLTDPDAEISEQYIQSIATGTVSFAKNGNISFGQYKKNNPTRMQASGNLSKRWVTLKRRDTGWYHNERRVYMADESSIYRRHGRRFVKAKNAQYEFTPTNKRMSAAIKQLAESVGGLSQPSKMPGYGYSLPIENCITGAHLATIKGTICSKCYGFRGNYLWDQVKVRTKMRLEFVKSDLRWQDKMMDVLNAVVTDAEKTKRPWLLYFRWHDIGDVQSVDHFLQIINIATMVPKMSFWLPTREYQFIEELAISYPPNLQVTLSAGMIDRPGPEKLARMINPRVSVNAVHTETPWPGYKSCPAILQGNVCGECRSCWKGEKVSFHLH
jgi:hypothetical protein